MPYLMQPDPTGSIPAATMTIVVPEASTSSVPCKVFALVLFPLETAVAQDEFTLAVGSVRINYPFTPMDEFDDLATLASTMVIVQSSEEDDWISSLEVPLGSSETQT